MTELFDGHVSTVGFLVQGHAVTLPGHPRRPDGVAIQFLFNDTLSVGNYYRSGEHYLNLAPSFHFNALSRSFFHAMVGFREVFQFALTNHAIGSVEYAGGREGENYIDRGSTSQMIVSLNADGRFASDGLSFRLRGSLDKQHGQFGQPVVPELARESYDIAVNVPWNIVRFLFNDVHFVKAMYERVKSGS